MGSLPPECRIDSGHLQVLVLNGREPKWRLFEGLAQRLLRLAVEGRLDDVAVI